MAPGAGYEALDGVRVEDNFDVQGQALFERPGRKTSEYPHRS